MRKVLFVLLLVAMMAIIIFQARSNRSLRQENSRLEEVKVKLEDKLVYAGMDLAALQVAETKLQMWRRAVAPYYIAAEMRRAQLRGYSGQVKASAVLSAHVDPQPEKLDVILDEVCPALVRVAKR